MKLLIEIPEEKYNYFISNRNSYKRSIAGSIINGQRLPDDCEILTKEAYADLCMRASKGQEPNCSEIPTGSTTKNDLGVDCISRDDVRDVMQELWGTSGELMDRLMALPSVTPQLSSELDKNSKKLEKDFGESDCISRTRAIERLKLNLPISQGADNSRDRHRYMQALADIQAIRELPSLTPQEPKSEWEQDHEILVQGRK